MGSGGARSASDDAKRVDVRSVRPGVVRVSQALTETYWEDAEWERTDVEDRWRAAAKQHNVDRGASYTADAFRRRMEPLCVQFYGAVAAWTARDDEPEVPSSVPTGEQLHRDDRRPTVSADAFKYGTASEALKLAFRLGVEDVDRAVRLATQSTQSFEILGRLMDWEDDYRRGLGLALLEAGDVAASSAFARCGKQSVQLECPDLGGGCGYDENYVPISCDHRGCPDCAKRRIGELVAKYEQAVWGWEAPTFYTFTIPRVQDPAVGVRRCKEAFGRLRRRTIPTAGAAVRDGESNAWGWSMEDVGAGSGASVWRTELVGAGRRDLAGRLEAKYVRKGRAIPFDELVTAGFYALDIKQKEDGYHVHIHALADGAYIPQAALSAVWEDITGAPVVDVRRIYGRDGQTMEDAIMETVAYACKPSEFETFDDAAAFYGEVKGSRMVQPFGDLFGNVPDLEGDLECERCELTPAWWTYLGVVDERIDNMGKVHSADQDAPPPEES